MFSSFCISHNEGLGAAIMVERIVVTGMWAPCQVLTGWNVSFLLIRLLLVLLVLSWLIVGNVVWQDSEIVVVRVEAVSVSTTRGWSW